MKKICFLVTVLFFIGLGAACTIHFPYELLDDDDGVHVVMQVTPDDADVLLNGRFIGAAYEFSTPRSALRLASRAKRTDLQEKRLSARRSVDLRSYSSRNITLHVEPGSAAAKTSP